MVGTSGAFRNDLLTPDVRFTTISCLGFTTGIPEREGSIAVILPDPLHSIRGSGWPLPSSPQGTLTRRHQLGFVLLIPHLLLLHAAAGEEEAHHPVEELVRELDGQGHHVHLQEEPYLRNAQLPVFLGEAPARLRKVELSPPGHPDVLQLFPQLHLVCPLQLEIFKTPAQAGKGKP
uniref:Uncharacterized protein n=1 Tax=Chrysemys picta bellii TaxID=8478 RepID=A0A8C3I5I6_CHRPI